MLSTILYKKDIEEHSLKLLKCKFVPIQKQYFLLCEGCFWMASTLPNSIDYPLGHYKKCPICKNKVDRFQISNFY
jgi:hypothetical protein